MYSRTPTDPRPVLTVTAGAWGRNTMARRNATSRRVSHGVLEPRRQRERRAVGDSRGVQPQLPVLRQKLQAWEALLYFR